MGARVGSALWTVADILSIRGVLDAASEDVDTAPLLAAFDVLVAEFVGMRGQEGAALEKVFRYHLAEIERLTSEAAECADARKDMMAATPRANLAKVLEASDRADPDRVAQELAILTVKADVTEEIDRLKAHVSAARALLDEGGRLVASWIFSCKSSTAKPTRSARNPNPQF